MRDEALELPLADWALAAEKRVVIQRQGQRDAHLVVHIRNDTPQWTGAVTKGCKCEASCRAPRAFRAVTALL
jgi:hypothetical protein